MSLIKQYAEHLILALVIVICALILLKKCERFNAEPIQMIANPKND